MGEQIRKFLFNLKKVSVIERNRIVYDGKEAEKDVKMIDKFSPKQIFIWFPEI